MTKTLRDMIKEQIYKFSKLQNLFTTFQNIFLDLNDKDYINALHCYSKNVLLSSEFACNFLFLAKITRKLIFMCSKVRYFKKL